MKAESPNKRATGTSTRDSTAVAATRRRDAQVSTGDQTAFDPDGVCAALRASRTTPHRRNAINALRDQEDERAARLSSRGLPRRA